MVGKRAGSRIVGLLLLGATLLAVLGPSGAAASGPVWGGCLQEDDGRGAECLICMPDEDAWNGDLVVYAHGYMAPERPVEVPQDQLVLEDGTSITETITALGYGFAATSYVTNGLAIREGVTDVVNLVDTFKATQGVTPTHVYLVGASEGGTVTALATEQHPDVFDGGVAACGPVGDFRRQIDYWGDVRVLFDTFFPGVLPGTAVDIPDELIDNWYRCGADDADPNYGCWEDGDPGGGPYEERVRAALLSSPSKTQQLLRVARVPTNRLDPTANVDALVQLLWYNVFATNDGVAKLGGQPFDNNPRWYWGSANDWWLNRNVARFDADPAALAAIEEHYQTSGELSVPIVTLHTLKDPVVPYWHEPIYRWKVWSNGDDALHTNIPSLRYGHCAFGAGEATFSLGLLVYRVTGDLPLSPDEVLSPAQQMEYDQLMESQGLGPSSDTSSVPSTIDRPMAPLIVPGSSLGHMVGTPTDELFVYAYEDGGYEQIPFQIDEVVGGTYTNTVGSPLDGDDEVVFMASDLGGLPETEDLTATLPISDTWYRLEVTDPLSPAAKGWAYLVRSSSLTQTFTETYASFITGTERISTTAYSLGFLDGHPGLDYLELHGSGKDILDRTKVRGSLGPISVNEEGLEDPDPEATKDGPVRVIIPGRRVVGYRSIFQTRVNVTPPFQVTTARLSTDFSAEISGATFYNGGVSGGVEIDGDPDAVPEQPLSTWWQVSDTSGTLVQVADSSGVGGTQSNYYVDDDTLNLQDTGDDRAYGDTGISVTSPNATIKYTATLFVLPPAQPNVGGTIADHAANPLRVTAIAPSVPVYEVYLPLALKN